MYRSLSESNLVGMEHRNTELTRTFRVIDLPGLQDYRVVWSMQKEIQRSLIDQTGDDTIIICQHNLVLTHGRHVHPSSFKESIERIKASGVDIIEVERGGDITCHEPGQIVAYPIFDLRRMRQDVSWFVRSLEEVVIQAIAEFGVVGVRIPGRTGVWLNVESENTPRKISSIGIKISRWCTMHGISINVTNDLSGFNSINPCGLKQIEMTSLLNEMSRSSSSKIVEVPAESNLLIAFKKVLLNKFGLVFDIACPP